MKETDRLPSFRHLKMFEVVAQIQSVNRASEQISLSQPAISQAISNIEARFGAPLFERRHDGSYLTQFGRILLERTQRLFALVHQGLENLFAGSQYGETVDLASVIGKITPTHIRCLVAVSESSSFDEAARRIGVSQPSLHRAARELEKVIRRVLYARGPRGISTTQQGSDLAQCLRIAVRELDYAFEDINIRKGIITSKISVGALATLGSFVIARAINDFLRDYPAARVQVIEEPYEQLLSDLRKGNIDFLFGVLRRPEWATDVREQLLFSEPYVIVARPGHPLTKCGDASRDELAKYDWIVPGPTTPRYLAFQRLFASTQNKPAATIETASRGLVRSILTMSDRLTLLTRHEAFLEQKLGVLIIIRTRVRLPNRRYGVATRVNWHPTALQRTFLETLVLHGRRAATDRIPDVKVGA
jgi:DNA-binding transcriptional LysR family regulator